MALFDKLKTAANSASQLSAALTVTPVSAVWSRYGDSICEIVTQSVSHATAQGSSFVVDDAKFKLAIVDPAWEMLPAPVRFIGRERLRWDSTFMAIRSTLFKIDGDAVTLHPEAKQRIRQLFTQTLQIDQEANANLDTPAEDTMQSPSNHELQS